MWASNEQFEAVKLFLLQYVSFPSGTVIDDETLKLGIRFLVSEGVFSLAEFKPEFARTMNAICPAEFLPNE